MTSASSYKSWAALYDAIYHWKDYAAETRRLRALLRAEGVKDGARVLEAACGTGSHLEHLRARYDVEGFDLDAKMLAVARRKLPGVRFFRGDMARFSVRRPFDALVCLFSSIGYVFPEKRLRAAARAFAAAVRPGGALVVEPWLDPRTFVPGSPSVQTYSSDDLKIVRACVPRRAGPLSRITFHWLVARRNAPDVRHFADTHTLWLCPRRTLLAAFRSAGFDCRFVDDGLMPGRGLIVGRRNVRLAP